jgi:hypothetical protein
VADEAGKCNVCVDASTVKSPQEKRSREEGDGASGPGESVPPAAKKAAAWGQK